MFEEVRNMKWTDESKETIIAEVVLSGEYESIGFVGHVNTVDAFSDFISEDFSEVGEYEPFVPTDEQKGNGIRTERDYRLTELDEVVKNPLRWASLATEQQQELAEYRQTLLDVTEQSTFPESVVWPTKPAVLEG